MIASFLNSIPTETWFDMGLLLDRLRLRKPTLGHFDQEGYGFITFDYGIDGVSIEISKYGQILEENGATITLVGGLFKTEAQQVFPDSWSQIALEDAGGFVDWQPYQALFHSRIQRGSKDYNALAKTIWQQTRMLACKLQQIVEQHHLSVLVPVNVCSNPGNVSLAFAITIVSEIMGIPVINSCHDFYWENGACRKPGEPAGLRDHFFTNAAIGEVFSVITQLYPWRSPLWTQAVLNTSQKDHLIYQDGINPASVTRIPTAIDTQSFHPSDEFRRTKVLKRLKGLIGGGNEKLMSTAVEDFINICKRDTYQPQPVIIGLEAHTRIRLRRANILLLQPTRILPRKSIECNFTLVERLLRQAHFQRMFDVNAELSLTLLVTGPYTKEHKHYFCKLIGNFREMLHRLSASYRNRIFLAFTFGNETSIGGDTRKNERMKISHFYAAANLVLLPSEQEGRGLPIIESAASGVPILSNRYHPESVFSEVVGEHLEARMRLKVFEMIDRKIPEATLDEISHILIDSSRFAEASRHNRETVKRRYSFQALHSFFVKACLRLTQPTINPELVQETLVQMIKDAAVNPQFHQIALGQKRVYASSYGQLEYLQYLKSIIDPSFFRSEEAQLRGRIFFHARKLIAQLTANPNTQHFLKKKVRFYDHVDALFNAELGSHAIIADHSFSYRGRHQRCFLYRQLSEHELLGCVTQLFYALIEGRIETPKHPPSIFFNFDACLNELLNHQKPAIDDRQRLLSDVNKNVPVALFVDDKFHAAIRAFVLALLKTRLGVSVDDDLVHTHIREIAAVTLFVPKRSQSNGISIASVNKWLKEGAGEEINLLHQQGLFKVVASDVQTPGTHLCQLGSANEDLAMIKAKDGMVIALGDDHLITFDLLDIPRYHIGVTRHPMAAPFLGICDNDAYVLWVPAGLRPTLAFPTPIQTACEMSNALKGPEFKQWIARDGEKGVFKQLRHDAENNGTPVLAVCQKVLRKSDVQERRHTVEKMNGRHPDGTPWNGAILRVDGSEIKNKLQFDTVFADKTAATVTDLIADRDVVFAWNGGYMLNAELVGKLGLSEDYIGSPLGLVIEGSAIRALPLFNKPALLFYDDGTMAIERVNLEKGFTLKTKDGISLTLTGNQRNPKQLGNEPAYFDLNTTIDQIDACRHDIYRFAGTRVVEIMRASEKKVTLIPVGLMLCVPADRPLLKNLAVGDHCQFSVPNLENVVSAIEAGPLLVTAGKITIDMDVEGWKNSNSIRTQAARLDYTHMRGPKIAAGICKNGDLIVVAINGRIRESVGATHNDVATIMCRNGAVSAMGFDPGGSVTLIVDGVQHNISPYNKDYEQSIIAMPPQARTVGNAIYATDVVQHPHL